MFYESDDALNEFGNNVCVFQLKFSESKHYRTPTQMHIILSNTCVREQLIVATEMSHLLTSLPAFDLNVHIINISLRFLQVHLTTKRIE